MTILRSGVDLIEIARLEELNPAIRSRFFQRVFTPVELEENLGRISSLAGRFAAKEAVAKALGCGIGVVAWKDIEILRGDHGQPALKLHGNAQKIANEQGLTIWSISISHTRQHALAFAVAASDMENSP